MGSDNVIPSSQGSKVLPEQFLRRRGQGEEGTKNSGFLESLSYAVIAQLCLLSAT